MNTTINRCFFAVGPQALGVDFIGRKSDVDELKSLVFDGVGVLNLVGPTRIGKSSLVTRILQNEEDQKEFLVISIDMSTFESPYQFWREIWENIYEQINERDAWTSVMEKYYKRFSELGESDRWYSAMSAYLPQVLRAIKKEGLKWILIIDEFDSVSKLFGEANHYYQFLRSLYEKDFHANGIVISRQTIESLEVNNPSVSTLHGVFDQKVLSGFSAEDMEAFYKELKDRGVSLTDDGKDALVYYTGRIPYLCCMISNPMILQSNENKTFNSKDIDQIHRIILPKIDEYHQDLVKRLKSDGHWEAVINLCFGSPLVLNNTRLKENMLAMGYLSVIHSGEIDSYYAYSQDFMDYLLMQSFELPVWDTLMAAERKLKQMFLKVYPVLDSVRLGANESFTEEQRTLVKAQSKGLLLNWDAIESGCRKCFSRTGTAAVIDGMSLTNIIKAICYRDNWTARFARYFGGNDSWRDYKLMQILDIRDPLAHDHYVTPEEMAACHTYCEELLRMEMYLDA